MMLAILHLLEQRRHVDVVDHLAWKAFGCGHLLEHSLVVDHVDEICAAVHVVVLQLYG